MAYFVCIDHPILVNNKSNFQATNLVLQKASKGDYPAKIELSKLANDLLDYCRFPITDGYSFSCIDLHNYSLHFKVLCEQQLTYDISDFTLNDEKSFTWCNGEQAGWAVNSKRDRFWLCANSSSLVLD